MQSEDEVATAVVDRIRRRANYPLALLGDMAIADPPLHLGEPEQRLLANSLRNVVKQNQKTASLKKQEVVSAKTVRGILQLIIKKSRNQTLTAQEADNLLARVQAPV